MRIVSRLKLLGWICLWMVGSCAPRTQIDPLSVAPGDIGSDAEYVAAIAQSQTSLDVFLQGLLSPDPNWKFVGLRVRLEGPAGEAPEVHWTKVVDYFDGIFTVELLDSADVDIGMHPGRQMNVPVKDVVDWIIVEEDGAFQGGYTVLLAYRRMDPQERKEFLEITGYVIR